MKTDYKFVEYGRFSSEFEYSQLFQLCIEKNGVQTGPFGSQLHKEDYVAQGTPIITVEHLGDNRIIHIDTPFVTDDDKNRLQKYQMKEGDIIFSRVGSVDRRALVRKDEDGWLFSGRCLCVRVDKTKINPTYLSYFFGLESFKKYIRGIAVGATMPSINTKILSDVPVYYPKNLNQQKQIAKILSDLDDKIHLNNQINQTLESIAQAIFKSWFIDFEPVRAKISAKQTGQDPELAAMYAISGKSEAELEQMAKEDFAELQATAALFPDELVESELGEVPKGWEVATIGKRFNVVMGQSPKGDTYNGNKHGKLFFQGRAEFGWRYPTPRLYTTDPKRVAKENDILMSVRAPVGDMNVAMEECCIGRGLSALSHRSGSFSYSYYCLKALQSKFNVFNGEGTVFGSINQNDLKNISFIEPINELIDLFAKTINKYDQRIKLNSFNTKSLIDVRDTLLPKLLSGEMDVSDLQSEGA